MKNDYLFYKIFSDDIQNKLIPDIKSNKIKNFVVCAAEESNAFPSKDFVDELESVLKKHEANLYVIIGSLEAETKFSFPKANTNIVYWPTHYVFYSINSFHATLFNSKHLWSKNDRTDKPYILMNCKAKTHRAMLIDELAKNNLLEFGYVSWLQLGNTCEYDFKYWKPKKLTLSDKNINNPTESFPLEYRNAFVNIIAETDSDIPFITEKTYHSILIGQPFIIFGSKNIHKILVSYGFELYDEIFDYSFDSDENINNRISAIIDNINKIKNEDFCELRKKIENKIDRNRQNLINIYNNKKFVPDFIKTMYDYGYVDFPYNYIYDVNLDFNNLTKIYE